MESLDYHLADDETLTRSSVRKLTPPMSDNHRHPVGQHPVSSFPEVLLPDKMMSLSLRADSENNQVIFSFKLKIFFKQKSSKLAAI